MALKSTIFKAALSISDISRQYYAEHALTLARHPSETDERMMMRLLAFAMIAGEGVTFGKGLCVDEEADVWQTSLTGDIPHWIDVGRPGEERIRKACAKARQVTLLTYGGNAADVWWSDIKSRLSRFSNLHVFAITPQDSLALAELVQRSMQLYCTIDGHYFSFIQGDRMADIQLRLLYPE